MTSVEYEQPLSAAVDATSIERVDRLWRAANYLSVGQIYLMDNPLLERPLEPSDVKRRLLGHWGTTPGINFIYAHLNRIIAQRHTSVLFVTGPGHGGPALTANTWLEGTYSEIYPDVPRDRVGMQRLFKQFSFPRGVPSHVAPETPGSIHEGGELGYSLAHAVGAAFDNPDLVVACVIGDGEAETGPLAASWQSPAFLDPRTDGAVLPILHLNGYKISNPTVKGRRTDEDLAQFFQSQGWDPIFVQTTVDARPSDGHQRGATGFDLAFDRLAEIKRGAGSTRDHFSIGRPMIVLRSPKGWTGPAEVDGLPVEGTWRAHQVPLTSVRDDEEKRELLRDWMLSYRPAELFDPDGRPLADVVDWLPRGSLRMGANPSANGGLVLQPLDTPDVTHHARPVAHPGQTRSQPTRTLGAVLRDVFELNQERHNFRLFGPDETESNRLDDVYAVVDKSWHLPTEPTDEHLGPRGRVMEVLSEHLCQGWLEGYLLSGRHGVFSCYEAFVHIVDSMFNQHAKWLKVHRDLEWREPIASLNYLLTSHVWQQDHNGFSHQDPGFIDHVLNKSTNVVRVYLPPDTNSLLTVATSCLQSRDRVNVIVSGKHPTFDWMSIEQAAQHCGRGLGVWDWASNDGGEPAVVLACAGDVPTTETLAAADILRTRLPELPVRVVNVVDLLRLSDDRDSTHGLPDAEFDELFTKNRPVIFAYHGYPWLIHRMTYRRTNHPNLHVRGYKEEGSTTTPFDMVVRNDIDRYRLVMDVIDRVPTLGHRAARLRRQMVEQRQRHVNHITTHGEDLPEVRDWRWGG